jgi:hypothetical protein
VTPAWTNKILNGRKTLKKSLVGADRLRIDNGLTDLQHFLCLHHRNRIRCQKMKTSFSFIGIFLTSVVLLVSSATTAFACSCAESPTVDKEFARAKHVAILKAATYLAPQENPNSPVDRVSGFNFVVQKVFKGSALKAGQQLPMISTGMCSFGFETRDLGREYLIYYFGDDRFEIVPMCTRSGAVEWRAADILYIENIRRVRGLSRISGFVGQGEVASVDGEDSRTTPLAGHIVRITGNGRNIQAKTSKNGVYEVYDLPSGTYRIEPERIVGFVPTNEIRTRTESANVVLLTNGHAEKDFTYDIDNAISGKLLSADGKPLARVRLDLIPSRGKPAKYFVNNAYSEKDGTFKFERIPKGSYVIVGNKDNVITAENPYPRFYASGTEERAMAPEIAIGPGDFLDGFVVRASVPVETVTISGFVRFADGSPVTTATVRFVTGDDEPRLPGDAYAFTDKAGNFNLKVLKGQKGLIFGYVPLNTWVFRGCPDRIKAIQLETKQANMAFPETLRSSVESASELSGVELKFTFTLCSEK